MSRISGEETRFTAKIGLHYFLKGEVFSMITGGINVGDIGGDDVMSGQPEFQGLGDDLPRPSEEFKTHGLLLQDAGFSIGLKLISQGTHTDTQDFRRPGPVAMGHPQGL